TPLADYAGEVVRLELIAGKSCKTRTRITHAGLHIPGTEPELPDVEPPKNVIVWLIDTLRADHLPMYNPDTDVQTPNLAAFAETATLFETVAVEGNESKVSHSSFFTGLYPIRHRHYRSSTTLKESFEIIPEAMRRSGRTTAGFISNGYISDKWGFD